MPGLAQVHPAAAFAGIAADHPVAFVLLFVFLGPIAAGVWAWVELLPGHLHQGRMAHMVRDGPLWAGVVATLLYTIAVTRLLVGDRLMQLVDGVAPPQDWLGALLPMALFVATALVVRRGDHRGLSRPA